jgi:nucleoside-diphosphate-sugar epimerase
MASHNIFVTGGTGFIGSQLVPELLRRGHRVTALARDGSESKLPSAVTIVSGDATRAGSYSASGCDTFVHLVGIAHPSPAKAAQFRTVDLQSTHVAVEAAMRAGVRHFVCLSVAQPSPVMKAYVAARAEGEALIRNSGMNASFVRPFYVLGPGRRWPLLLRPFFAVAEHLAVTRETARRLTFVTLAQMRAVLIDTIENPPEGVKIWTADDIRAAENAGRSSTAVA